MKLLILCFLLCANLGFSSEVNIERHRIHGQTINYTLKGLAKGISARSTYISARLIAQGGLPEKETNIIIHNIYNKDVNERYKMTIGYQTEKVFRATGNIKSIDIKKVSAFENYFSGYKRDLFEEIFSYVKKNKEILTGEVRFIVEPYSGANPYKIAGTIQYILK